MMKCPHCGNTYLVPAHGPGLTPMEPPVGKIIYSCYRCQHAFIVDAAERQKRGVWSLTRVWAKCELCGDFGVCSDVPHSHIPLVDSAGSKNMTGAEQLHSIISEMASKAGRRLTSVKIQHTLWDKVQSEMKPYIKPYSETEAKPDLPPGCFLFEGVKVFKL